MDSIDKIFSTFQSKTPAYTGNGKKTAGPDDNDRKRPVTAGGVATGNLKRPKQSEAEKAPPVKMTKALYEKMKKDHIKSVINEGNDFVLPKKDTENSIAIAMETNQNMVSEKLDPKLIKSSNMVDLLDLATAFVYTQEQQLKVCFKRRNLQIWKLYDLKSNAALIRTVAHEFRNNLVEGTVQLNVNWTCQVCFNPSDDSVGFCDHETLLEDGTTVHCWRPVCLFCTPQMSGFTVDNDTPCLCDLHNSVESIQEFQAIDAGRVKYEIDMVEQDEASKKLVESKKEHNRKKDEVFYNMTTGISRAAQVELLPYDVPKNRQLTQTEINAVCENVENGRYAIRTKALDIPEQTIFFDKEEFDSVKAWDKMHSMLQDIQEKGASPERIEDVWSFFNIAKDLFSKDDFDTFNQSIMERMKDLQYPDMHEYVEDDHCSEIDEEYNDDEEASEEVDLEKYAEADGDGTFNFDEEDSDSEDSD